MNKIQARLFQETCIGKTFRISYLSTSNKIVKVIGFEPCKPTRSTRCRSGVKCPSEVLARTSEDQFFCFFRFVEGEIIE